MSEPTQAHHEKSTELRELVDEIRGQVEAKGRIDWVDGKNLLRMIDALHAERSIAPATPTHLALFDKLRDEWNGEIEPGQPCFDTFSACLAGLSDAIEKSRAAAPPATQTGDVRKGE
jgi:hypothetical protein